jgi:hypothetical protein
MWRPNEPDEEDVSTFSGIDPHSKRRRSRRRAWRDGLADQTVVKAIEDVRSYRAFERTLISSVDPRTLIELELVDRLVSLLWRLHRATAIETGLFDIQSEFSAHSPARRFPPTRSAASNPHSSQWSRKSPSDERTRRSAGPRPRAAVDNVDAPISQTVEVPCHRPMLSAPLQPRSHIA